MQEKSDSPYTMQAKDREMQKSQQTTIRRESGACGNNAETSGNN
jgi:hypothetical protein